MDKKLLCGLMAGIFVGVLTSSGYSGGEKFGGTPVVQASASSQTSDSQVLVAKKDYLHIGFELLRNETIGFLSIGMSDRDVLNGLGEPEEKSVAKVWPAVGWEEHQYWYYPTKGIELCMIRKEGQQVVERVSIKSPCEFKTKRGIGIGSTNKEAQDAYENEINPNDSKAFAKIIAGTIYGGIMFGMKDGVVSSVFSGAAAE